MNSYGNSEMGISSDGDLLLPPYTSHRTLVEKKFLDEVPVESLSVLVAVQLKTLLFLIIVPRTRTHQTGQKVPVELLFIPVLYLPQCRE